MQVIGLSSHVLVVHKSRYWIINRWRENANVNWGKALKPGQSIVDVDALLQSLTGWHLLLVYSCTLSYICYSLASAGVKKL